MVSGLTRILTLSTCLAVLAIVAVAPSSSEALEAYLTVVGNTQGAIHGDSKVKQAQGAIVVQAIGLGLTIEATNVGGAGNTVGRPDVAPSRSPSFPTRPAPSSCWPPSPARSSRST